MTPDVETLREVWWCNAHQDSNGGFPNPVNGRFYCRSTYDRDGDCDEAKFVLLPLDPSPETVERVAKALVDLAFERGWTASDPRQQVRDVLAALVAPQDTGESHE